MLSSFCAKPVHDVLVPPLKPVTDPWILTVSQICDDGMVESVVVEEVVLGMP
jgi:hypothetical protein